jgi:hypothetical protein
MYFNMAVTDISQTAFSASDFHQLIVTELGLIRVRPQTAARRTR